jgi:ATP-binding cassette subfamily B protein
MNSFIDFRSETFDRILSLVIFIPRKRIHAFLRILLIALASSGVDVVLLLLLARISTLVVGSKAQNFLPGLHIFAGSTNNQVLITALVTVAIFWLSSLLRYAVKYLTGVLCTEVWSDFANRAYSNILSQDYLFFKRKRTVTLAQKMNRLLGSVSDSVVQPIIGLFSSLISATILLVGLVAINGAKALLALAVMITAYVITSILVTPHLRFAAKQIIRFSNQRNRAFYDAINSIVDVHLYASEQTFVRQYAEVGEQAKRYEKQTRLLPELPRYIIEPAGVTVLILTSLVPVLLTAETNSIDFARSLTFMVTMLAGLLKISPPLQSLFRDLNKLRGGLPNLDEGLRIIQLKPKRIALHDPGVPTPEGLFPRNRLSLNEVSFRYTKSASPALRKVSISIPVGSRVAFVGRSGSGKTTAANILLGLLKPQRGCLALDGICIEPHEVPAWQANCAVVPQSLTLLDGTICQNVAFGQPIDSIDMQRVSDALSAAQLSEYIDTLPYGLMTAVGENGVKLSGGQRQRLSLARAIYKGARLLVLDEATSALDNITESQVMDAIELIGRRCTIVIIAHRMTTVKKCDKIYEFSSGKVVASGSYSSLLENSESFRHLHSLEFEEN